MSRSQVEKDSALDEGRKRDAVFRRYVGGSLSQGETFPSENTAQNQFFPLVFKGFGIIKVMKSFILFALIVSCGSAFGGTLSRCQKARKQAPENCNKEGIKAAQKEAADAAKAAGCGKNVSNCAGGFSGVGAGGFNAYQTALATCDQWATTCNTECKPDSMEADQKIIKQMKDLNKECQKEIKDAQKEIAKGAAQSKKAEGGGEDTKDSSKDEKPASSPAMPPAAPPKSDDKQDDKKTDATQQQPAAQEAAKQEQQQEKEKDGKSGFDDKTKAQSVDPKCAGENFKCPGCPGYISNLSADNKKILADKCAGASGNATTQAITNPKTPQSIGTGSGMGAGGGGAGSTVSGGANTQAMLDDGKKNDVEAHAGHKEGGSLGTEGGGGGGGGGSDSFGSSGGNPFGDAENSLNMGKAVPRSLASAFQSSVDSNHSVVDRYGPNLFNILGDTIRVKCERNQLLHCPNK